MTSEFDSDMRISVCGGAVRAISSDASTVSLSCLEFYHIASVATFIENDAFSVASTIPAFAFVPISTVAPISALTFFSVVLETEYDFVTDFFTFIVCGCDELLFMKEGYDKILESLNKYDAVVLIAVVEDNDLIPVVYYSTNHHLTPAGTALDDFLGSTHNL